MAAPAAPPGVPGRSRRAAGGFAALALALQLIAVEGLHSGLPQLLRVKGTKTTSHGLGDQEASALREVLALQKRDNDSRPVLTVEIMNGLGNQLFQVAAALSLALDHHQAYAVELPDVDHVCFGRATYWHSVLAKLRPLLHASNQSNNLTREACRKRHDQLAQEGACVVKQVPAFDPAGAECGQATAFAPTWADNVGGTPCKSLTLYGYFQNTAFFTRHFPLLRRALVDEAAAGRAAGRLAAWTPPEHRGRPTVALHYRLGDYDPNGWVLGREYYADAVKELRRRSARGGGNVSRSPVCFIFSDDPERAWARSEALAELCGARVRAPAGLSDVESFWLLGAAEASVLADSTFGYWSALLAGSNLRTVVVPEISGPAAACWSYLRSPPRPAAATSAAWISVPASTESPAELLAEEVMSLGAAGGEDDA